MEQPAFNVSTWPGLGLKGIALVLSPPDSGRKIASEIVYDVPLNGIGFPKPIADFDLMNQNSLRTKYIMRIFLRNIVNIIIIIIIIIYPLTARVVGCRSF